MRSALVVAGVAARRLVHDRTATFFLVAMPVLVIVILGSTLVGFDRFKVAVVVEEQAGELAGELRDRLADSEALEVVDFDSLQDAQTALRRNEVYAVVLMPQGMTEGLSRGEEVTIPVYALQADGNQQAAFAAASAVINDQAVDVQAATFVGERTGEDFGSTYDEVRALRAATASVPVEERVVDGRRDLLPEGFSYSAPTMLVLFVFINGVAGGATLIESRRLGMYERMLAAPVGTGSIILGESLVRFAVALVQSVLIVGVGALVFGVDWGDPVAASALVLSFGLVGTGAGMLSGTLFRTPEQASSVGPPVGIALGMLGGCMWPLELVPSAMRTIGHLTPHAWAVDGWTAVLSRDAGLGAVTTEVLGLLAIGAGLLVLSGLRLSRRLLV